MSTINGIDYQLIKKFLNDAYNTLILEPLFKKEFFDNFQYYFDDQVEEIIVGVFNKQELLPDLPNYLNKLGTTKAKEIASWPNIITEEIFYNLLRMQTEGCEYYTFEYYILKFNLQTDSNHMIIFTEEFPFDGKIKKEALFIWGIFNYIKHHPILKHFLHYISYIFQEKIGLGPHNKKTKAYDVCIPNLQIAIEIDENHQPDEIDENDNLINTVDEHKTATLRQNGLNLIRINFQEIYTDGIIKDGKIIGKGEITQGNANKYLLNSEYYRKSLNKLSYTFMNALLRHHASVRSYYVEILFKQMLDQRFIDINSTINDNVALKSMLEEEMRISTSINNYEMLYNRLKNIQKSISCNIKYRTKIQRLIAGLSLPDFIELFQLKDKAKLANYESVLTHEEVNKIIDISDEEVYIEFLCKNGIISNIDIDINDITYTWKQLNIIISKLNIKEELQELLFLYYLEVDESYEKIITRINEHTNSIQGDPKSYNICAKYIEAKAKAKYNILKKKLKKKYNKLIDEFEITKFGYSLGKPKYNMEEIKVKEHKEFEAGIKIINDQFEEIMKNVNINSLPPPFTGVITDSHESDNINSDNELASDNDQDDEISNISDSGSEPE